MKKIDPYHHERRYKNWVASVANGIPGLSETNSDIIRRFIRDMELGLNVSPVSKKGMRSHIRLNTLREKSLFFARQFQSRLGIDNLTQITEERLHEFFAEMRSGIILRNDRKAFTGVSYYVKAFKTFWHWYMLIERKAGRTQPDITTYLDARQEKPKWVYLEESDIRSLCDNAKLHYRVLMMFLLDSGIRAPTELVNVRVQDLSQDCTKLTIRDEVSKTFGRTINLLLCPSLLKAYLDERNALPSDPVFPISPTVVNRYLQRLAKRVLGEGESLAGERFSRLTLYDFRHSSACYWLPRYKSESALKYRFGWKKTEQIHYYTHLLGMQDNITQDDLLVDVSKTEIEEKLNRASDENAVLRDQVQSLQRDMARIASAVDSLYGKVA